MPTIKIDINTGIEYSPTDGIDSAVKLHNFTVGTDGSLYKLPALKNLKNTYRQVWDTGEDEVWWFYRLLDIRKFQTSAIEEEIQFPPGFPAVDYSFREMNMFRRFIYLTTGSYGVVNVNYDGKRIKNPDLPFDQEKLGEFEYKVFEYKPDYVGQPTQADLSSLSPKILVDFNAQYDSEGHPTEDLRCVFPMQHMFQSKFDEEGNRVYPLLMEPRNMIHCSMDATSNDPDIKPLTILDIGGSEREKNDLARGCVLIGNRMFFYSALDNAIFPSAPNIFTKQMKDPEENAAFKIVPPEEIQAITDFNGNVITFTPSGMDRWVLSGDNTTILQMDPTFHFDHRIRYGGSFVKANRDLYYYTDDFQVYRLDAKLGVDSVFEGNLPVYKPLEDYLVKDQDLPMAYFEMLGYRLVSIGPWLYNIDSNTWSTYSYDGWKKPTSSPTPDHEFFIWDNNTNKRVISTAYDDLICTYSTICRPLTYKEMQDEILFPDTEPSLIEDKHQWGEISFFTTRMFQDEKTFSLDGVEVYVRGGMLARGSKIWLKILRGADLGDFDEEDEATYGIPAAYEPCEAASLGESQREHVGKFIWRTNIKTDRFRLQFITKEKRGIVVQSVLANITTMSDSQNYLVRGKMKGESQGG
jgi:hypothetical protein